MKAASVARALLILVILVLALGRAAGGAGATSDMPLCMTNCATAFALAGDAEPFGITRGPLHSIWFSRLDAVDRIDQTGKITTYHVPTPNAMVGWLLADGRGAVWFAERGGDSVGRVTTDGKITEYPLPFSPAAPQGMVRGPDGNLYITEQGANAIARLNPRTGQVQDFPVPTPESTALGLALGPDGALWFIERTAAKVGRMTLDGRFTEWPLAKGAFPNRIVAAPDGALWFTELKAGKIGRITTAGVLTRVPHLWRPCGHHSWHGWATLRRPRLTSRHGPHQPSGSGNRPVDSARSLLAAADHYRLRSGPLGHRYGREQSLSCHPVRRGTESLSAYP